MKLIDRIPSLIREPGVWLSTVRSTFGASKGVQLLSGVLVVQLAVAGGLLWRSNTQGSFSPAEQLVNVDPTVVDEIIIDDGDTTVTLTRADDQWAMDDEYETLASAGKIDQLISDVTGLKPGLPVASTQGSHQQLEVAQDSYQRRITLKAADETMADLFMGTSPGFRKSHLRQAGQDQVYAVRLNTFDVPADQDGWLDQNLLAFESVTGMQSNDIELALADDKWSIVRPQDQLATHEIDQPGVNSLVSTLNSLRVNGFAAPLTADEPSDATLASDESDQGEIEPLLSHSLVVVQNDSPITLTVSRKAGDATIERSDVEGLFALPIATYEKLTAEAISSLVVEKSDDEPANDKQPQG